MSDRSVAEQLGHVPLFAGLSRQDLERIAVLGKEVDHDPGKVVAAEGRSGIAFHLVLGGSATVQVGGHTRAELGPGEYFGEISMIDGKPRSATVQAGPNGLRTFAVMAWNFQSLLDANPQITRSILVNLCGRLRAAQAEAG